MAEICNLSFPRKGKKIVLTWIERNFKPKLFETSEFKSLESPLFETEESVYKIRVIPCNIECSDRVACLLTKVDPDTLRFPEYFVDCELTIDNKTWKLPETKYCFDKSDVKFVSSLNALDLRNENKFPPECLLTVKFGLRRCIYSRPCMRYASATTELPVITMSTILSFRKSDSSEIQQDAIEEERVRNELAVNVGNERVQNAISIVSRRLDIELGRRGHSNFVWIRFNTGGLSQFLRIEFNVVDVRNNIVIPSRHRELFISGFEFRTIGLLLPRIFVEKFENFSAATEELNVHVILSCYSKEQIMETNEPERGFYFCAEGDKRFSLKSDLKNFYYSKTKRPNFCIKVDEKIFPVHREILAARSPVFKAMLETDMVEKRTCVVKIKGFDEQVLKLFLKFIYSSELEKDIGYENAVHLYAAADIYGIVCLLPICRRELIKNISAANLYDLLILSHLLRDSEIKELFGSILSTWYFKSEELSRLKEIMDSEKPLTEGDGDFLKWIKTT